jgi:hypothetical protein
LAAIEELPCPLSHNEVTSRICQVASVPGDEPARCY